MLEVGDVTRRERTGIGLIGGRESCGELYEEAGIGGIGDGGSSCDTRLCCTKEVCDDVEDGPRVYE